MVRCDVYMSSEDISTILNADGQENMSMFLVLKKKKKATCLWRIDKMFFKNVFKLSSICYIVLGLSKCAC